MYELDCTGLFPGCHRVIRAETEAEVMRRALAQARQVGIEKVSPALLERIRMKTRELVD